MTTTLHTTDTQPVDLTPPDAPVPDDPRLPAGTHVQINGELANRLMRSSRWQQ
jgi:hypothetical protein